MGSEQYFEANRKHWDEVVPIHVASGLYDVASFKAGASRLKPVEREELTGVRGKGLLHIQCHFGLDTLSWAREGAVVTGIDFSEPALEAARSLAEECGVEARFIQSDVYSLPEKLAEQFDIVFTSYGAICWLPEAACIRERVQALSPTSWRRFCRCGKGAETPTLPERTVTSSDLVNIRNALTQRTLELPNR